MALQGVQRHPHLGRIAIAPRGHGRHRQCRQLPVRQHAHEKAALERGMDVGVAQQRQSHALFAHLLQRELVVADDAVADAVRAHDAVVSAFSPGWSDPALYDNFLRGSAAIEGGVAASGVRRLLVVGGAGSLFVAPGVQLVDTPAFLDHVRPTIVPGAQAARDVLNRLRADTVLDWTFLSPPALLGQGDATGSYRVGADDLLMDGDKPAGIAVADLALAIADEIEQPRHLRARFTVASQA